MARQTRRTRPGDAANLVIRCLLSDAGGLLGGLSETQWLQTLDYFGMQCAYTGQALLRETTVKDHAIPINKDYCGLHVFGNVLPCTREVNADKHHKHYRDFVTDGVRLAKIENFIAQSGYWDRIKLLGNLYHFAATQYLLVTRICDGNRNYVKRILEPQFVDAQAAEVAQELSANIDHCALSPLGISGIDVLPIEFSPSPVEFFKGALLERKRAWISTYYANGQTKIKPWNADHITATSNIITNLRSRREFRQGEWKRRDIVRVLVSIANPLDVGT